MTLIANARNPRTDPTRTTGLRARFQRDMVSRFNNLKKDIKTSIVDNNCFGVRPLQVANEPLNREAFAFERDIQKLADFIAWLERQEELGILSRVTIHGARIGTMNSWMDTYIDSAYQQGIRRARQELRRAGHRSDYFGIDPQGASTIRAAFNMPIHAETVAMLYTRTFEDLKTVTQVMNATLRRTIADGLRTGISRGLAEGKPVETVARELVRDLANGVDKIGITRARLIARTETVRAHHLATIEEYRFIDSEMEVTVQAEFKTAGAGVCDECLALEGKIFTLAEAAGIIPVHPNCRCIFLPAVASIIANIRKRRLLFNALRRAA